MSVRGIAATVSGVLRGKVAADRRLTSSGAEIGEVVSTVAMS